MASTLDEPPTSRVIIKNIPKYYVEDKLREFVQNVVKVQVTDIRIPKDKTGNSRKFAFVGLPDVEHAQKTIKALQNTFLDTCRLNVSSAYSPGSSAIPRPWSRHAAGSSSYKKCQEKEEERKRRQTENKNVLHQSSGDGSPSTRKDSEKLEFIQASSKRRGIQTWTDYITSERPLKKFKSVCFGNVKPMKTMVSRHSSDVDVEDSDGDKREDSESMKRLANEEQKVDLDELIKASGPNRNIELMRNDDDDDLLEWLKIRSTDAKIKGKKEVESDSEKNEEKNKDLEKKAMRRLGKIGRLLLLNLPYSMTNEELTKVLRPYGELSEVHVCRDEDGLQSKGRAFVSFVFPEHAVQALSQIHLSIIQGRVIRAIPAEPPKEPLVAVAKVAGNMKKASSSYKRQLEEKLKQRAGDVETWNLLYVSANAATDAMANQMGIEKRDLLGVGLESANAVDDSAAARVALGESQLIHQTKQWLKKEGINLSAFERQGIGLLDEHIVNPNTERSSDCIIVKHLPLGTKDKEIFELFSRFGPIARYCLAPSGTVAIAQFMESDHAKKSFKRLAYSRFKNCPLFLEWAPVDLYTTPKATTTSIEATSIREKINIVEEETETDKLKRLVDQEDATNAQHVSLFVKNLSFQTTDEILGNSFSAVKGFVRATIARKKKSVKALGSDENAKAVGLSMGYGFVEFNSLKAAVDSLKRLQGMVIDGRSIQLQMSERSPAITTSTENEQPSTKNEAIDLSKVTNRLVIRNLAFQASKTDLRKLFSTFGNVAAVRIPTKADGRSRGYGFVEMLTRSEALSALEALQHTHLYGRRLIIEPAKETDMSIGAVRSKQKQFEVQRNVQKFSEQLVQGNRNSCDEG